MCDYRSNQSSNLNTHIRKKHNTIILVNKYWIKVEIKLAWNIIVLGQLFGTRDQIQMSNLLQDGVKVG